MSIRRRSSQHTSIDVLSLSQLPVEDGGYSMIRTDSRNRELTEQLTGEQERDRRRTQHGIQSQHHRQNQRVQAIARQATLYNIVCFLITQLPTIILRIWAAVGQLVSSDEATVSPLLLLQAILWPLQGWFNYLIYCWRPSSYLRESILRLRSSS